MKTLKVFILIPLFASMFASANSEDGIDHQPRMARTARNYEKSCALQYKLFGILAQGIRDNNDEYINIAILKFAEFNYPKNTYSALSSYMQSQKDVIETFASLAPPSVTVSNSLDLQQFVSGCAEDPANKLLNYRTAFIK